jgi:hypothetical protein
LGSVCFDRLVADPAREGHFKFINDEDGHAIFLPESAFFMKDGASTGLIEAFCPDGLKPPPGMGADDAAKESFHVF